MSKKYGFSPVMKKQDDMRRHYQSDKIKYYIGDVRDIQSIRNAMHGVDYVHADSYRFLPVSFPYGSG